MLAMIPAGLESLVWLGCCSPGASLTLLYRPDCSGAGHQLRQAGGLAWCLAPAAGWAAATAQQVHTLCSSGG